MTRLAIGFGEQGKLASILLATTGDSGNSGRTVKAMGGKKITLTDRGMAPVLVERITSTVTLLSDRKKTKCYTLDPNGERKKEVPVRMAKGRGSKIILKPDMRQYAARLIYNKVW